LENEKFHEQNPVPGDIKGYSIFEITKKYIFKRRVVYAAG